ncbi:MAG: acetyl/propionyl/methylcrotonyl-CoA carboxylase subunit alpha [Acidobacteriia bacterium]|nr:acetyl/propionyl/methylcrotonyl-CoA carboxylase subunit alpha [Methyloceanibacter sp.]MCL6490531.1 acetyl/propionyl/methylcrotonyl-CoA carboxylase subunit alpha [Terriglobia bacterium]
MFRKILIANRGEIAVRIIRTARKLGISPIAVYSDADAKAQHVALADAAYRIGPAPSRESYLNIAAVLDAARRSGAEAIHPGYGFLSENPDFAEACVAAGIVFIGPPAAAIRAMGSKAAAKELMRKAGVPLIPGYHGEAQDTKSLAAEAARLRYPIMIKASAGGGGKGMRLVERAEEFEAALAGAKREALAAFGDDTVLLEKYLPHARHVEVQIFSDTYGNAVYLFERDCSIQRRHQKIIEEAPAPGVGPSDRRAMGEAAVAAARAVGYVGAGTVEFLRADSEFYFMEMNTRLQVEHPVTEMITGQDLVEWQLRVAAGEKLPLQQEELRCSGHAIEARIYAEDPARDFLPSIGTITHLRLPEPSPAVRVDCGVRAGDAVRVEYDPMIAKLIVHGETRAAALRRLATALAQCEVAGVETNLDLLRAIAEHPEFAEGGVDTNFLERHPEMLRPDAEIPEFAIAAIVFRELEMRKKIAAENARAREDPYSPWAETDAWALNLPNCHEIVLAGHGKVYEVRAFPLEAGRWRLQMESGEHIVSGEWDGGLLQLCLDETQRVVSIVQAGDVYTTFFDGKRYALSRRDPSRPEEGEAAGEDRVRAPIPGYVRRVFAEEGQLVERGAALVVLEAMKMELTLTAPIAGRVETVAVAVGEMVQEGQDLVALTPAAG